MAAAIRAVSSHDAVVAMGAKLLPHAEYPQIGHSKSEFQWSPAACWRTVRTMSGCPPAKPPRPAPVLPALGPFLWEANPLPRISQVLHPHYATRNDGINEFALQRVCHTGDDGRSIYLGSEKSDLPNAKETAPAWGQARAARYASVPEKYPAHALVNTRS